MNQGTLSTIKVSLCPDCIQAEAYPNEAIDHVYRLGGYSVYPDPNCSAQDCGHFRKYCDGCSTELAGARYCYLARSA